MSGVKRKTEMRKTRQDATVSLLLGLIHQPYEKK
jgi:hypothetical protein